MWSLFVVLLLGAACSDRGPATLDTCCRAETAPDRARADRTSEMLRPDRQLTDRRILDAASGDTRPRDTRPGDTRPAGDGSAPRLLLWDTQCQQASACKPYCGAIGSKSEGWYDGCTKTLLKNPLTGNPYWEQCSSCTVSCLYLGTYSQGWYATCP